MKNNSAKNTAHKLLLKTKHYSLSDYKELKRIVETNDFTIINFRKHNNSAVVSELINRLEIENEIQQNDSFLYMKNNLKLLFINSDLPQDDKCALLRHELGHICDPNLTNHEIAYSKIKKEEFANEFSFYVKNTSIFFKLKMLFVRKWRLLISLTMTVVFVLGLSFVINSQRTKQTDFVETDTTISQNHNITYYVTSGGKKYHKNFCIIVKYRNNLTEYTLNEATDAGYEPCQICVFE